MKSIFNKNELLAISNQNVEDLQFSGNGKRRLLILILNDENGNEQKQFLKKILNAKKIDLENDAFLLHMKFENRASFFQIKKEKQIDQIIFFATTPEQIGLNLSLKKYQIETINGITIMRADEISKIEKNEQLKRELWGCLKDWPLID